MKRFLILRFSSIGDIVLTTPVIRSLRKAYPEAEIHYFTKPAFKQLLVHNPYLDRVHVLDGSLWQQARQLRRLRFDHVLDLHRNLRTLHLKALLGAPSTSFDKQNLAKYRMVRFKRALKLDHIVTRYGATLRGVGATLDEGGLDFFLPQGLEQGSRKQLEAAGHPPAQLLAVVLGATYPTKRWLPESFVELLNRRGQGVLLLGGPDARAEADYLLPRLQVPAYDAVGTHDLLTAAAMMKGCQAVLAHDTGFMHIAAAFGMRIFSLWGNTVPEFGMTPYRTPHHLLEVKGLGCRPCSKIGFSQCPKGHFRCMKDLQPEQVLQVMEEALPRNV